MDRVSSFEDTTSVLKLSDRPSNVATKHKLKMSMASMQNIKQ